MNKLFSVRQIKKISCKYTEKKIPYRYFQWECDVNQKFTEIWETLHSTQTPSSDQGKLQFCFRFDISTNERVQCNKFSKSQEKIKGKRKLSQFLISDFCFASLRQLAAVCSAASSSIAANWLGSTTHESGRGKQNALRRLSVSIPHTPPLSRGLWLILGQRVSQRHLTERERGQRER